MNFFLSILRTAIVVVGMLQLFLNTTQLKASHNLSTELSVRHLGNNQYEVNLIYFTDCDSQPNYNYIPVFITSASCGITDTLFMSILSVEEVSFICPAQIPSTSCFSSGSTLNRMKKYLIQENYEFPAQCSDWVLNFSECCRGIISANIEHPYNLNIFVKTEFDNLTVKENNTPQFLSHPAPTLCVGEKAEYNLGAFDIDGDSLAYSLMAPFGSSWPNANSPTPMLYFPPFSPSYPLSTTPANDFQFDSLTGQMTFTPDLIQKTIVTVLVEEYRKGVKIGSTIRDLVFVVENGCTNLVPVAFPPANITGGTFNGSEFEVCAGQTLGFSMVITDPDPSDIIEIVTNLNALPGATVTTNGTNPVNLSFSWATSNDDAGMHPFTFEVNNNSCMLIKNQIYGFNVIVSGVQVCVSDSVICPSSSQVVQLEAFPVGRIAPGSVVWSPSTGLSNPYILNPIATVNGSMTYTVCYFNGSCNILADVEINSQGTIGFTPEEPSVCLGSGVQLTAEYIPHTQEINACDIYTGNCVGSSIKTIFGTNSTSTGPSSTSNEAGSPFMGYFHDGKMQVIYTAAELNAAGITEGLITELALNVSGVNSTQPYNDFTISLICSNNPIDITTFYSFSTPVYTSNYSPVVGWNSFVFANPYYWNGVENLIVEFCFNNNQFSYHDHVYYTQTPSNSVLFKRADFNDGCTFIDVYQPSNKRPNIEFTSCPVSVPSNYTWSWSPITGLSDPTISNPIATPATTTTYVVSINDGGCIITESVTVEIGLGVDLNSNNPTCTILNNGTITALPTSGIPPFTYVWSDPGIGNTATATGLTFGSYSVTVTDGNGCSGTNSVVLSNTNSIPPTALIISNPKACPGDIISLTAVGGTPAPGAQTVFYEGSCGGTVIANPASVVVGTTLEYFVRYEDICGVTTCVSATLNCISSGFKVEASVQLEGPYRSSTSLMEDDLRVSNLIPLTEPYTGLGYTHVGGGGETTVSAVFSATGADAIVDWVLVELRSASDNTVAVATRSALLQADGDVVDIDGSSGVDFNGLGITAGQYWVVVRHRTHLDVMSLSTVLLDGVNPGFYNFNASGAYGNGLKTLPTGAKVMMEGDVNQDGLITAADRSILWNNRNLAGYHSEDSSMDGICAAADRSQNWNNRNNQTQVP